MSKKILVILHVYYSEQIPYFIGKMKNVHGTDWDLLVTGSNLTDEDKGRILSFKEDASFLATENRGYDIAPFICAVKSINLDDYWFVIKLHTKNLDEQHRFRHNGDNLSGRRWRNTMVDAILGSPDVFDAVRRAFEDETVGLLYSLSVNMASRGTTVEDSSLLTNEIERLGLKPRCMDYCAGTILAIRAEALRYLQDDKVDTSAFSCSGPSHSAGTLAHTYERILCIASSSMGFGTVLVPKSKWLWLFYKVKRGVEPTLEWIFSINHFGDKRDKFLTILGIRINLTRLFYRKGQSIAA